MTDTTALDVYDAACLAGGPDRMVDTALAVLLESGRVRVQRSAQLTVVDPRPRDDIEAAVLAALERPGFRTAGLVRSRAGSDERVTRVTERLVREGLLSGRTASRWFGGRSPLPTAAGRRALRALKADPPVRGVVSGSSAARVALHGPAGLPDAEIRVAAFGPLTRSGRAAAVRRPSGARRRSRGWYGTGGAAAYGCGGGADGGGSGCGGGSSCGGGGGGGCGGGGGG
jgi:hypothetical protein